MSDALTTYTPKPKEVVVQQAETAATAIAAQAKALVEARYIMAMRNPRNPSKVRQDFLIECERPYFARVAMYNKPIGNGVAGPSIRFVETAIRCLTNVIVETAAIYDDKEKRIVRVAVSDLESNTYYSHDVTVAKTVEKRFPKDGDTVLSQRTNSKGQTTSLCIATDDEILNKQNALISKAIRTLGLRIIPGDLIDQAKEVIDETTRKADKQDPDAAKNKLFDSFGDVGVGVEQLIKYLGHDAKMLNPKELKDLRGFYAAIRDGETTWREIMDAKGVDDSGEPKPPDNSKGTAGLKAALEKKAKEGVLPKVTITREVAFENLLAAYEAKGIKNADEQEADFARRARKDCDLASASEILAVVAEINAEIDKRNQ